MTWRELITDDITERLSHSKLASLGWHLAGITGFLKVVWQAQATEGLAWLFLVALGIGAGSPLASRIVGAKWGQNGKPNSPLPETKP